MPAYKYTGNRILTTMQNAVVGTDLSEWHSGYRAYSVKALESVPFERNADGFNFDTQIIVPMPEASLSIAEVPIPPYSGDENVYVTCVTHAKRVHPHATPPP